jgi:hypothetical protein
MTHLLAWNQKQLNDLGTKWVKNQTATVVQKVTGIDNPA